MTFSKSFLLLISFLAAYTSSMAQWSLGDLNLVHQYDPNAEAFLKCQPIIDGDSLHLLVGFEINQDKAQLYDYEFDLFFTDRLTEKLAEPSLQRGIDSTYISSDNQRHVLKFSLKNPGKQWVIIRVVSKFSGFNLYFETPVFMINAPGFSIYNETAPLTQEYITPGVYSTDNHITGFYYSHEFPPALPPMAVKARLPEKSMAIDSTFKWAAHQFVDFKKEGLYYFQHDTSSTIGRALLLSHKYYPRLSTLEQLKAPLIYMTTKAEKEGLEKMSSKKEFDEFWLELTDSPERAKRIIKEYYNRVEFANKLFSTFKAGWKTDPGMRLIIFCTPDEVIKRADRETWIYLSDAKLPKVKFEFIRTNNIFSSSYYTLLRDKKYDGIWFRSIDLWRKSRF